MKKIFLSETGIRDGLQALSKVLPTELKVECIHDLVDAGIERIEVAAFVHPKYVPSMADAEAVCSAIKKKEGILYTGLVINERGLDRALDTPLDMVSTVLYSTETFSQKNARMSFDEVKVHFKKIAAKARLNKMPMQAGIAAAFGCRYEGKIDRDIVIDLIKYLLDEEVEMIGLADTTGMGVPNEVHDICGEVIDIAGDIDVGLHLHNTENRGYANVYAALQAGIQYFDTAFGGLGGCPFVPKATGNIATEDTAQMLHLMGYETGVDIQKVLGVSRKISAFLERDLDGMLYKIYDNQDIKILK